MIKKLVFLALIVLSSILVACGQSSSEQDYVGEWSSESSGYFVFNSDGSFRWYLTNDKNENNVNVGTWSVGEVQAKDGRDLTLKSIDLNQEYIIVDGVRNEFPNGNYLTQLVILEEKEDVLAIYNMNTNNGYEIEKVK